MGEYVNKKQYDFRSKINELLKESIDNFTAHKDEADPTILVQSRMLNIEASRIEAELINENKNLKSKYVYEILRNHSDVSKAVSNLIGLDSIVYKEKVDLGLFSEPEINLSLDIIKSMLD